MTSKGRLDAPHNHILHQTNAQCSISAFLQNQMCYLGQELVYADASETLERLLGIKTNAKQIERVCHHYGDVIESQIQNSIAKGGTPPQLTDGKKYYAMLDGSMLLTREEKWKEIKLARIFSAEQKVSVSKGRNCIGTSTYVAHLGKHTNFLQKVEYHLDSKAEIIFVADGAPWIWKWVEAMYPESTQILDFYHAKEHLCQWAAVTIGDETERNRWIDYQSLLLLNDKVEDVIKNIRKRPTFTPVSKQKKKALLEYYTTHKERMKYRTFKIHGLIIGSGAIEAANRHVIQQRMKLSGQRWTIKGAQQIANLRTLNKSNQWEKLTELTSIAA